MAKFKFLLSIGGLSFGTWKGVHIGERPCWYNVLKNLCPYGKQKY